MRGARKLMSSLLLGFAACGPAQPAAAENWPQQAVRVVVPFPAGSGIDVAARIVADGLAKRWERPVMVETNPAVKPSSAQALSQLRATGTHCSTRHSGRSQSHP